MKKDDSLATPLKECQEACSSINLIDYCDKIREVRFSDDDKKILEEVYNKSGRSPPEKIDATCNDLRGLALISNCVEIPKEYCLREGCAVEAPFSCNNEIVSKNSISLELKNVEQTTTFEIQSIQVTNCGTFNTITMVPSNAFTTIVIPCSSSLANKKVFVGDITITYKRSSSNLTPRSVGRLVKRL